MEILRFDEPDAPAPKRKRPSKAWLALSLVAALMGVGTAFASSTINLNSIDLGQGVTAVVTCDTTIGVVPNTGLSFPEHAQAYFELKNLVIGAPDTTYGNEGTVNGYCDDKYFKITLYDEGHKAVGIDAGHDPEITLCDFFTKDSVDQAIQSDCVVDTTSTPHTASIYFKTPVRATDEDAYHTYTIPFSGYNLTDVYLDPANITVETVSNYPIG